MKSKAYLDGVKTGKKFNGSEKWNYTPGGPYSLGHRKGDDEKMRKFVEKNIKEVNDWWEGFNSTCAEHLKNRDKSLTFINKPTN
jgi:hypothetical protein